jgi:hypothetical protein
MLIGNDNGHSVRHDMLVKIEHRDSNGRTSRYQMQRQNRTSQDYNYSTLVAKNGVRGSCPKGLRQQREWEAAQAAQDFAGTGKVGKDKGKGKSKEKDKEKDMTEEEYWTWSGEYEDWYHIHKDGSYEWAKGKEKGKDKGKEKDKEKDKTEEEYWTWSGEYETWYHIHEDGTYEWAKGKGQG